MCANSRKNQCRAPEINQVKHDEQSAKTNIWSICDSFFWESWFNWATQYSGHYELLQQIACKHGININCLPHHICRLPERCFFWTQLSTCVCIMVVAHPMVQSPNFLQLFRGQSDADSRNTLTSWYGSPIIWKSYRVVGADYTIEKCFNQIMHLWSTMYEQELWLASYA